MSTTEAVNTKRTTPKEELAFRKNFMIFARNTSFSNPNIQVVLHTYSESMWHAKMTTKDAFDNAIMLISRNKAWPECPPKYQELCSKYLDWYEKDKGDYTELHGAERQRKAKQRKIDLRALGVADGKESVTGGGWTRVKKATLIKNSPVQPAVVAKELTTHTVFDFLGDPAVPMEHFSSSEEAATRDAIIATVVPSIDEESVPLMIPPGPLETGATKTGAVDNKSSSSLNPTAAEFTPTQHVAGVQEPALLDMNLVKHRALTEDSMDSMDSLGKAMAKATILLHASAVEPLQPKREIEEEPIEEVMDDDNDDDWEFTDAYEDWDTVDDDEVKDMPADGGASQQQQKPAGGWLTRLCKGKNKVLG